MVTRPAAKWTMRGRSRQIATACVCLALTVLSFVQRPGQVTFDTKLDLTENPLGFLSRALHLWNPQNASGELQNQAYGYFFPMGPFFAGGDLLGIPPWITQRLWCALLLCVAFYGTLRLARAMRIGTQPARYVAALGYTLAPRMLTEIGPVSAEMLPVVLLPWVMLPLVNAHLHGPRRAAGLSALGVLLMGGINATVILAALVLPGLWLMTREWTREHLRLVLWWCGFVVLACLWWLIPLLLLGRYSLPFLDYIESAANTTGPLSLAQVLRGTDQWVAYLAVDGPWWPAGFALVNEPVLIVVTVLVTVLALTGLLRSGLPERRFLLLAVVLGTLLIGVGYVGALDSPLSETFRELLDGPLAPFRNVHKFEPVLRLPLMLCLAHAMSTRWLPAWDLRKSQVAVAAGLVVVLAAPAWQATLRPGLGWEKVPDYWRQALDWVAEDDPDGRTLLLPATGFGRYLWGDTIDEPAQTMAKAPWSVRNQVPLGSEGNTRLMDAIQDAVDTGIGSPALAGLLTRSGYDYLLVRNDIDAPSTKAPPRTVMRQALLRSPGIERAATFGPQLDVPDIAVAGAADQGTPPVPAIEVYRVDGASRPAATTELSGVPTVSGGPESLLQLLEQGLIEPGQPTLFAEDRDTGAPAWMVADGLRKRERNVGIVRRNTGQTMTVAERPRMTRPARDIVPFSGDRHTTTAEYTGIASVTASSSRGYADAFGGPDRSYLPFAAIDGDPATAWRSSSLNGAAGQWIEVTFDSPRLVGEIVLRFVKNLHVGQPVRKIRIDTDLGSVDTGVVDDFGPQSFGIPKGLTSRLRITVLDVERGADQGDVAISELAVPGVKPVRALRVPIDVVPPAGVAPTFSFSRGTDATPACFTLDDESVRCDEEQATLGEEPFGPRRVFRTGEAALYSGSVTVTPSYSGELPLSGSGLTVAATSQLAGDPSASAYSAIDDDPNTAWIPDGHNVRPTLTLRFPQPRRITSLRLHHEKYPVTSRPTLVRLITPFGAQSVKVARDGTVRLPRPMNTNKLQIRVDRIERRAADVRFPNAPAPVGVFEVDVNGEPLVREIDEDQPFTVPCGLGPTVRIDERQYTTTVTGTVGQNRRSEPMRARLCGGSKPVEDFELLPGIHRLTSTPSNQFVVRDIALTPSEAEALPVRERETTVRDRGVSQRSVRVGPGEEAVLTLTENANPGWQATLDGRTLQPTRVDGWRQAWVVPAGAGGIVQLEFAPDDLYRLGLIAGAVAVLLFLLLLLLPARGRPAQPLTTRTRWPYGIAAGALVLLGGWVAALGLAFAVGVGLLWRRTPGALAATGFAVAVGTAVWGAVDGGSGWAYTWYAQAAWLAVLTGIVAATLTPAARAVVRLTRADGAPASTTNRTETGR